MQIVEVSNATDQELVAVGKAILYLDKSPTAESTINGALAAGVTLNIVHNGGDDYRNDITNPSDPYYRSLDWDPNSELRVVTNDGTLTNNYQSPALGLGHEFDHFFEPANVPVISGGPYSNTEEQRVIVGFETPVAKDLGEPTRTNHYGDLYIVQDPTSHAPGTPDYNNDPQLLKLDPPKK
jgi:hypothetical protein